MRNVYYTDSLLDQEGQQTNKNRFKKEKKKPFIMQGPTALNQGTELVHNPFKLP